MKKEMIDKKSATMFWVLMAIYVALFVVLAINPVNRPIWFAENVVVWIVLGVVLGLYWRGVRFSRMAYVLIFVPLYLHTIGGHWTYAHVPFGWVTDHFGSTRNNFDKVAHFTVGFYAYPVAEWIWGKQNGDTSISSCHISRFCHRHCSNEL